MNGSKYPSRIVCLTEETTETLYLLGEGRSRRRRLGLHRAAAGGAAEAAGVGVHQRAASTRSRRCSPTSCSAFSDLQADIAAELMRRGYPVVIFNQRSVAEILQMIRIVGGAGRLRRTRPTRWRADSKPGSTTIRARGRRAAAAAAGVLRGVGRAADLRHPLGRGAGRDCRRRADLSRAARRGARQGSHRRPERGRRAAIPR